MFNAIELWISALDRSLRLCSLSGRIGSLAMRVAENEILGPIFLLHPSPTCNSAAVLPRSCLLPLASTSHNEYTAVLYVRLKKSKETLCYWHGDDGPSEMDDMGFVVLLFFSSSSSPSCPYSSSIPRSTPHRETTAKSLHRNPLSTCRIREWFRFVTLSLVFFFLSAF